MKKTSKKKHVRKQRKEPSDRVLTTRRKKDSIIRHPSPILTAKRIKTVFVTGASGFVGKAIITELLRQDYHVIAFLRQGSDKRLLMQHPHLTTRYGDVLKYDSLVTALTGVDAIIHLVGIIEEGKDVTFEKMHVEATLRVTDAAKEAGVMRFVHMSALGTRPDAHSRYHKTKFKAEEIVRRCGLEYTIFRPSLIFGQHDKSINMFAKILRKQFGVAMFPILGKGKMQPISVEDVALGMVNSLKVPESVGQIFDVGGPQAYTLKEIIGVLSKIIGKRVVTPRVPYPLARSMVAVSGPFAPLNADQLRMLQEDNVCDPSVFSKVFDVRLREFEPRLREYL